MKFTHARTPIRLLLAVLTGMAALAAMSSATASANADTTPEKGTVGVEGVDFVNPERPHCLTTAYPTSEIENRGDTTMKTAICFATEKEVAVAARSVNTLAAEGISVPSASRSSFAYQAIGKHCDGYCNLSGPTLTINGTNCNGGGLTFSSTWKNKISDSQHKKCEHIRLYSSDSYQGLSENFYGDYNDYSSPSSAMNNEANSAKYFGPVN